MTTLTTLPASSRPTSHRGPRRPSRALPRPATRTVGVLGTGMFAPHPVLTNSMLEGLVATSDEWIVTRTGMRERRVAERDQPTSELAIRAARAALDRAHVEAADVDVVILATVTPDTPVPACACRVQHAIGATRALAFDVNAGCAGFVTAFAVAEQMLAAGAHRTALVIGADQLTRITDYHDRDSCVLFGDGAGAVVLGADATRGVVLGHHAGSDGSGAATIEVPAGGSRLPASEATVAARQHFVRLNGREVFKFAVQKLAETVTTLAEQHGVAVADIDHVVPHQANLRILESAAKKLGLPLERFVVNLDRYGNTSAASVPMALHEAAAQGRLRHGDLVCTVAFGAGLTWGGSLIEW